MVKGQQHELVPVAWTFSGFVALTHIQKQWIHQPIRG